MDKESEQIERFLLWRKLQDLREQPSRQSFGAWMTPDPNAFVCLQPPE